MPPAVNPLEPHRPGARPGVALTRGAARLLRALGYGVVTEMPLATGRRVDAIGVDGRGRIVVVEVKSGPADFLSDRKWPEYRDFCDAFYFAVPAGFPTDRLPEHCGLMVVDPWGGSVLREAPEHALAAARRKAMLIRLARAAGMRLHALVDPE
jgi:hypothetical protein